MNNIAIPKIKIIGYGNIIMSDDGIGIRIIEELEKLDFFRKYELITGGTSGIDLIFELENSEKVLIIDAIDAGQDIAGVVVINAANIKEFSKKKIKSYSLHDFDLSEVLKLTGKMGLNDKITIVGIKPEKVDFGESLSPAIEEKIPDIIISIKNELIK